jgi:hypothetical protein
MGWHGKDGKTSLTGYTSTDPNVCSRQLHAMLAFGGPGAGLIALSYGPTVSPFIHQAVMTICSQAQALGMPFGLCFDPWTVKNPDGTMPTTAIATSRMIAALQNPDIQLLLGCDNYIVNPAGQKMVLDFSTTASKPLVMAAVPGINLMLKQVDYDWVMIPEVPNKTDLPCTYMQFDDGTRTDRNMQVWDQSKPCRVIPSLGGNTFWNRNISAGDYVQFCTWNDVAEGTDVEKFSSILLGGRI